MTVTTDAPRRGRPPLEWLDSAGLRKLPVGVAVHFDQGLNEFRVAGRVLVVRDDYLIVRRRDRTTAEVRFSDVLRGRIVGGMFEPGDPVVMRDTGERAGVVSCSGIAVSVETESGYRTVDELDVDHADDLADAMQQSWREAARSKPGRKASDPGVEDANQAAFQARAVERREAGEGWAD